MARDHPASRIAAITDAVEAMGALVCDRLETALAAFAENDAERARAVRNGDRAVNDRYLAVERRCIETLALEGPVASDLRIVVASFKIITDLERIGDLAVNLAECALATDREPLPAIDIDEIGAAAVGMVEDALAAYREGLAELSRVGDDSAVDSDWLSYEVDDRDADLDARCAHASDVLVRALIDRRPDDGGDALLADVEVLLLAVRDLERVGDHAVNVAARTHYMATGSDDLV